MFMSCHQNAGQNHNMKRANKSLQNVVELGSVNILKSKNDKMTF
jgi:hypothetical protein